jgi:hypothetical protein
MARIPGLDFGIQRAVKAWREFSASIGGFYCKSYDQNSQPPSSQGGCHSMIASPASPNPSSYYRKAAQPTAKQEFIADRVTILDSRQNPEADK